MNSSPNNLHNSTTYRSSFPTGYEPSFTQVNWVCNAVWAAIQNLLRTWLLSIFLSLILNISHSSFKIPFNKMSQTDNNKIVYPKLQRAVNYHSWRENMISLFKRDQAYKIALSQQSKPTEPIYLCDLTKLQFKTRLLTDTASSEDSATVTPQSEESIIIRALAAEPLDAGA